MEEKRIVAIDPKMFKIQDKTRKKREPNHKVEKQLKIKNNIKNQRSTTMKRKLLNFIRKKQELKSQPQEPFYEPNVYVESFDNEFQESLDYLDNLSKQTPVQSSENTHNKTFKSYNYDDTPIALELPESLKDISDDIQVPLQNTNPSVHLNIPNYGCLKNGNLPTYRKWKHNQTQRQYPSIDVNVKQPVIHNNNPNPINNDDNMVTNTGMKVNSANNMNSVYNINPQKISSMIESQKPLRKPKHRRKIIRRKFTIGRSKIMPKVSVLVSNKTIRKNIYTNKTLLKQTPLEEVKKFLIKRGFIKIGSLAPPDILRQMYESVKTLCGDATNHNPENLLYNYFNYNEEQ